MKVVWTKRAIRHLETLRNFIAIDSEQNAAVVAGRIVAGVELLETHPEAGWPGRLVGTRELVAPRTSYLIPYRIRGGRLDLLAILHGRQKWPSKFP